MMADIIDIKLDKISEYIWDIDFNENGEFDTVSGFETSLTMSLFTDKRVDASEVSTPERRRGWIGDELFIQTGFTHGSKLWLLDQARVNFETRNSAEDYAKSSLEWLVNDGFLKEVKTIAEIDTSRIIMQITGVMLDDSRNTWSFKLWQNTQGLF